MMTCISSLSLLCITDPPLAASRTQRQQADDEFAFASASVLRGIVRLTRSPATRCAYITLHYITFAARLLSLSLLPSPQLITAFIARKGTLSPDRPLRKQTDPDPATVYRPFSTTNNNDIEAARAAAAAGA